MKKSSYLLRIDDVCPTMSLETFQRIQEACDSVGIKPLIGIIPDNQDAKLQTNLAWDGFWPYMKSLVKKDWRIAQHGYRHIYNERKSEFAGLPYDEQLEKIQLGQDILAAKLGTTPTWFMAPAHSLDRITCKALRELSFTHITDGIAPYPFQQDGLTWIPQQLWKPLNMPFGLWTICIHPSTMTEQEIQDLLQFLQTNSHKFQNISLEPKQSLFTLPMRIIWNTALALKKL